MAEEKATLTLKLGDHEVRYEAEREAVEAQLQHVLGQLLRHAPADVQVGLTGASGAETAAPAAPPPPAEAGQLKQLFRVGTGKRLRLRKLPGRTADALLLVLYGMLKLQNRKWVYAPGMTGAARASGVRVDRADRLLAGYDDLVEGFGRRRGKRYRLTAAGREHCARLVASLAEPVPVTPPPTGPEPSTGAEDTADETAIPQKVTSRWQGELLTELETAERLGVDAAEVGKLRRSWQLLGLPGGDRKRRRFFYPAFQIDADRREIVPQAREANRIVGRTSNSWDIAKWWTSVHPRLGRKPIELIGTPEADAVVDAARVRF